jgi:hypothetical protein
MIGNDMEFLAHLGDTSQTNGMITYQILEIFIFTTRKNKHYQPCLWLEENKKRQMQVYKYRKSIDKV